MNKLRKLLLVIPMLFLSACSKNSGNHINNTNRNTSWTHTHISMDGKIIHDEVIEYYYYGHDFTTVELNLKTYGWVKVSYNNCLLYTTDKCPLCNK